MDLRTYLSQMIASLSVWNSETAISSDKINAQINKLEY